MSVVNVFFGPYLKINDSKIVLATVFEFLLGTGMATKYLVRSHIILILIVDQ